MPRPRLVVGLTGGIGSGKSTVAHMFEERGVPTIDADVLAHELAEPGQPAHQEILAAFGPTVVSADGRVNRKRLRSLVFGDANKRRRLERILHPRIRSEMIRRLSRIDSPYCLLIIPLLLERDQSDMVDRILVVDTTPELQARRTEARDGTPRKAVEEILQAQMARHERLAAADDIIENCDGLSDLQAQVDTLHGRYLELAQGHLPPTGN